MNLEEDGCTMIPNVISAQERGKLIETLGPVTSAGRRGLMTDPTVAMLANSDRLRDLTRPFLPAAPQPVRAIYFDKSPDTNWLVAWHQDLTIAVRERIDLPGFGPWSVKSGVPHVQPPAELLERMLTIRLHLDDADAENGALRVLSGSHRHGRLSTEQIQQLRVSGEEVLCEAKAGDALLMRPLLLHASGHSTSNRHRRILHIEYAGFDLPQGLQWQEG